MHPRSGEPDTRSHNDPFAVHVSPALVYSEALINSMANWTGCDVPLPLHAALADAQMGTELDRSQVESGVEAETRRGQLP